MQRYLPDSQLADDWRASPHNADSHAGLPDALVLTAQCDVLHDEGVTYAAQMKAANVPVEHIEFTGMIHGFISLLGLVDDTERAYGEINRFLQAVFKKNGQ